MLGIAIPFGATALCAQTLRTAAEVKSGTRIFAYLFSQTQMQELYRAGVFQDRQLGLQQDCKQQYRVKPVGLEIVAPIDFPEDQPNPTQGIWKHRFEFERCGDTKTYNVVFIAKDGEYPRVQPYYPGATSASVPLISDAMKSVATAARSLIKEDTDDCKELFVADMNMAQLPHDVVEDGATFTGVWSEKWTILACGRPVDVFVQFIPKGNGGTTFAITSAPP